MPRPGPRPYECIRRAWHSDSHQPLRGALIQEIFRVVNELHSISTRRKKEWQEKLPIVVLRAEEILYSKANSENEYAGVETLKNRLEDAVNTMIRRDDSEEEGLYLPPCVEAALSLGCTPKKIPRGQRQISARLLPNGARQNGTVSTSNNGSCKGLSGKGRIDARSAHDSCVIGTQKPQMMQDHCFSTAFAGGGSPPLPCFGPSTGFVFPQNLPLPASFEASHPSITQSLPQLGGLVQFLKSADPVAHGGGGSFKPGSFPIQINVNHDSRALQYSDSCTTATITPPVSSLQRPTLGRDAGSDRDQLIKTSLAGSMAPCMERKMIPQAQQIAPRPDFISMNAKTQQITAGPDSSSTNLQGVAPGSAISSGNTQGFSSEQSGRQACHVPAKLKVFPSPPSCFRATTSLQRGTDFTYANGDDLQLRLGPPGIEASSTSDFRGDPSAPKRSRVEQGVLDGPESKLDRFTVCDLVLPQDLTWSKC